jgi:MFS family permease
MSRPWRSRNVLALSLVSLLTDASSEMIYPLLPAFLATTLGAGATAVGAIEGAAQALASLLGVFSGRHSDWGGRRKRWVVAGYFIASVLRPLTGLAQSVAHVMAIRLGDRVGKGLRGAPRDALIADSVPTGARGAAFGFHRGADHAGAVIGPLVAFALLQYAMLSTRTVFLLAGLPAAFAVIVAVAGVREPTAPAPAPPRADPGGDAALPGGYRRYLATLFFFTLGNSTDAFLLLRAQQAGIPLAHLPLLWAALHVVRSVSAWPGGALADRFGRRRLLAIGWAVYAAVYVGFGWAQSPLQLWGLMLAYGLYTGCTEGAEKALVADLVGANARGRAYGWFNATIGVGALPASLLFGVIWDRWGSQVAFSLGAVLALAAAGSLALLPPARDVGGVARTGGGG